LHINFEHIFVNSFSILVAVSFFEREYGPLFIAFIYLVSGIGGNIFSACVDSWSGSVSAGASTGITGIIGLFLAEMIVNWEALGRMMGSEVRCMLCCCRVMQVLFLSIMTSASISVSFPGSDETRVSSSGHFGGFLTGLMLTLVALKPMQVSEHTKWTRYIGLSMLSLYFLLCFVLFYTIKEP
jgi:membrane associated rhomboid family serine protease